MYVPVIHVQEVNCILRLDMTQCVWFLLQSSTAGRSCPSPTPGKSWVNIKRKKNCCRACLLENGWGNPAETSCFAKLTAGVMRKRINCCHIFLSSSNFVFKFFFRPSHVQCKHTPTCSGSNFFLTSCEPFGRGTTDYASRLNEWRRQALRCDFSFLYLISIRLPKRLSSSFRCSVWSG